MKIPLVYPKIPDSKDCPLSKCFAFEKYDGTNLHFSYNHEKGWVSFGTRRDEFELSEEGIASFHKEHSGLEDCISLFERDIKALGKELLSTKYRYYKNIIVFTEYLGENSFAGEHIAEPKKLIIIDLLLDGEFLFPQQFTADIGFYRPLNNPKMIYSGKYSGQLVEDIKAGKFSVKEGVIIKGIYKDKVYMAKVKTNHYMERLKEEYKDNWKDYWE